MSRARVGIFTSDFHPIVGGIGMMSLALYEGLRDDHEFEPLVFSPAVNDFPGHHRLRALPSPTLGPLSLSLDIAARLEGLVRSHGLDVLHFMGSSGGVQVLRKPPRPALFTLHNTYHYLYRELGGPAFRALRALERRSLRNADLIVPASYGVRDELPVRGRIQVVPNGIDTRLFGVAPREPGSAPFFLFLGRLGRRKGVLELVQAFARTRPADFELWFAGGGPLQGEILRLAAELGVAERVRMLGYVERAGLPDLYRRAHAVVLPSYSEGFPLTVAEAMTCGALFIGTRIPGILEQIEDGVNGLLCLPRDVESLAGALRRAAELAPAELAEVRRKAAESARAYSLDAMLESYRELYRCLLRD